MTIPIVPKLLRSHLEELAANDSRIDGRERWEGRELEIEHSCCGAEEAGIRPVQDLKDNDATVKLTNPCATE